MQIYVCPPSSAKITISFATHRLEFKNGATVEKAGGGVKAADHDILSPKAPMPRVGLRAPWFPDCF